MGEISSIHLQPSKNNNTAHNDRTVSPSYLLKANSLGVECNLGHKDADIYFDYLLNEATKNYTKRTGQKLQSKNYKWSAVVNIKESTTMDDLKKLASTLEKEYGWQCYQIAIHRDEGHSDKETGNTVYNLHAHLEFLMLNKGGIYCYKKRDWGIKRMKELQDLVANQLQMKRGTPASETKKKRLNHYQYRQQAQAVEEAKEEQKLQDENVFGKQIEEMNSKIVNLQKNLLQLQNDFDNAPVKTKKKLEELKSQIRKAMIDEGGFTQDEYKVLNATAISLKTQLGVNEFTVNDVIKTLLSAVSSNNKLAEKNKEIASLQAQLAEKPIRVEVPVETVKEIIVPRQLTDSEIEELPRVIELSSKLKDTQHRLDEVNTLLEQEKNNIKTVKEVITTEVPRELTDDEIEELPKVIELSSKLEDTQNRLDEVNTLLQQEKNNIKTVKEVITTEVPRELTDDEIEELPRVKDLQAQIDEYEEGLKALIGRIDDEGYPEIADKITNEKTVKGVFEKISEFFSDCLKGNLKKAANVIRTSFIR